MKVTHPNKVMYDEDHYTKQDIIDYYDRVAEWILPYVTKRLLTLVRCPQNYQECFFQKHPHLGMSTDIDTLLVQEKKAEAPYLYITNKQGLLALIQMGTLEIHPWGSPIKKVNYPDMLIFDLDPAEGIAWQRVVEAAFTVRDNLAQLKLQSFVKTTGGKGLHVVVPIQPMHEWDTVKNFTQAFAKAMVTVDPEHYIATMSKMKRKGKLFIDYLRNARGATSIAPYSTRSKKHAPVAVPLHWDELTHDRRDTFFTIKTIFKRLDALKKDPWEDFFTLHQSLPLDKIK